MNNDQEHTFEKYLNDQMSEEEKSDFERDLQNDQALAGEYNLYKQAMASILFEGRREMKKKLQQFDREAQNSDQENTAQSKTKKIDFSYFLKIAAVIIILAVPLFIFYNTEFNYQSTFISYYEPFPNSIVKIERNESNPDLKYQAFLFYEKGEFEKSKKLIIKYLEANPSDEITQLYLGVCYLSLKQPDLAISTFNAIDTLKIKDYRDAKEWYLALAYLQKENKEATIIELKKITLNKSHSYYQNASKLLSELD